MVLKKGLSANSIRRVCFLLFFWGGNDLKQYLSLFEHFKDGTNEKITVNLLVHSVKVS